MKEEGLPSHSRQVLGGPGDTIRSKIEDRLTEEKLIQKGKRGAYALGAFGPGADILGPMVPRAPRAKESIFTARRPGPRPEINKIIFSKRLINF